MAFITILSLSLSTPFKKRGTQIVTCPRCENEFDINLRDIMSNFYSVSILENENKSLEEEITQINNLLATIKDEVSNINKTIEDENNRINNLNCNYENYVARKAMNKIFAKQLSDLANLNIELVKLDKKVESIEDNIKSIKEKVENAKNDFCLYYENALNKLDVTLFSSEEISAFKKISLSGSLYVRSTLAFFFSFLETKKKYNKTNYNFPLLIDSPREGEQDNDNSANILKTLFEQSFDEHQLIVASVNASDFLSDSELEDINVIRLNNEVGNVMCQQDFESFESEMHDILAYFNRI